MAEVQAARRLAKRKAKKTKDFLNTRREQTNFSRKDESAQVKTARRARREDWELGPLAPRRDVGHAKETYGTINAQRTRGQALTLDEREQLFAPFGGKFLNIVAEDRVVVLEGRDKGKIGKIANVDRLRGEVTVRGLNMVDVAVPKWMIIGDDSDKRPVRSMEKPLSISSIRLVHALPDPTTGIVRDVIVKRLINSRIFHDRHSGTARWSRIIPGLNIKVPWPKIEPKKHKDNDCDTLRADVESRTFVPSLLHPPMPGSVINELRNKYSIFRTRHDEEYVAAKMVEDAEKEAAKKFANEMRTPLKEVNRRENKLRKAKGKGKLTTGMLVRIGKIIARSQGKVVSVRMRPRRSLATKSQATTVAEGV